jgi:hypothetical protein
LNAENFNSNFYVLEEGMVSINYNELLSSKEYLTFVNVNFIKEI